MTWDPPRIPVTPTWHAVPGLADHWFIPSARGNFVSACAGVDGSHLLEIEPQNSLGPRETREEPGPRACTRCLVVWRTSREVAS